MKSIACVGAVAIFGTASLAMGGLSYTGSYGWEDGGTVIGSYAPSGNVTFDNVADPVGDDNCLVMTETPLSGTPQGFVSWITGLNEGDTIDVSMWGLGDGETTGKIRLWGHYTTGDVSTYGGSASGSGDYSTSATEWVELSHSWTFAQNSDGTRNGLVIEARLYAYSDNVDPSGWIDDITVNVASSSDDVSIMFPAAIPAPGALALLGLAGMARRRRRG